MNLKQHWGLMCKKPHHQNYTSSKREMISTTDIPMKNYPICISHIYNLG